jgi:hypothetical protein
MSLPSQPDAGTIPVPLNEDHARALESCANRRKIVRARGALSLLKVHNRVARNGREFRENGLIHIDQRSASFALGWSYRHFAQRCALC